MSACPIAIIADSTCDIPAELIERYHIEVVPQIIIWGNQELRDRVDIQPAEFYQRLSTSPQLPTTSQPTVKSFGEHYQAAQAEGATDIIVFTVSSAMSGTYQSARQAAHFIGSLLDLKPLVEINHQTGLVEGADRVRTRRKGIAALYQRFFEKFGAAIAAQRPLHLAVLHGGVPEDAALLAERIQREYQPADLVIGRMLSAELRQAVLSINADESP